MKKLIFFSSLFFLFLTATAQDALQLKFNTPPAIARPRVWWHWMNGNITKEGIQKDLDWMERSGIAGFQNFDASLFTPVMVKNKLTYMTPEWKDAFAFTTALAKSKNLEMAIAGSPGWSVTGGPWVSPEDAMKKYVWSEQIIKGGQLINVQITKPSYVTGPMQNTPFAEGGFGEGATKKQEFYKDIAVIAFPLSSNDLITMNKKPIVTSSGGVFSFNDLNDGDLENFTYLPPKKVGEEIWIQYEYPEAIDIASVTLANEGYGELAVFNGGPDNRSLTYSINGTDFFNLCKIPGTITSQTTLSFIPVKAKYIRLCYITLPPADPGIGALFGMRASTEPTGIKVSEFNVFSTPRINLFETKAGFEPYKEEQKIISYKPSGPSPDQVVDLSTLMKEDGTLNWNAPSGDWIIYRFGYSLTGKKNHPASPEATGLEVDKLDRNAVTRYLENYLDQYKDATKGLMGKDGLSHMVLDSYEAGHMTWTHDMFDMFKSKRGYDMHPWMPVLVGRIVGDLQQSEKFLWDFRKTIGELIVENHYELIGDLLAKRGMKRYTESHENGRIYLADGMDVKRKADIPMAAMWQPGALASGTDEEIRSRADIRESASVAHLYGQNIVAGESMTTVGNFFSPHPGSLKRTADMEMASGLNRFVIHTSVHQPIDSLLPGFSLGPFGQWFTRQETWAEQAKAWTDYLSRSSFMLQQGKFVADVLYYYGENTNITSQFNKSLPNIPSGYEYDFANATVLIETVKPENKKLVSPSGMKYSILVLDTSAKQMTLKVLQRLVYFAKAGIQITGQGPISTPSLADDVQVFEKTLKELKSFSTVQFNQDIKEQLRRLTISEDIVINNNQAEILYVHRKLDDREIYWLNSRSSSNNNATISFRVHGKKPMKFNPETGEISELSYTMKNGRTNLDLTFTPWDAYFIVFEEETKTEQLTLPSWKSIATQPIEGTWKVRFQENRVGPKGSVDFSNLISFTKRAEPEIKYFSGIASYQNSFEIKQINKDEKIQLDLGEVKNLAEVYVNGKIVSTLWKKPFMTDITKFLKQGTNNIEIKVVNSWVNRLVGDAQPGAKKMTFIALPLLNEKSPLEESGLLGPVNIKLMKKN
jgi:hypothetical protein